MRRQRPAARLAREMGRPPVPANAPGRPLVPWQVQEHLSPVSWRLLLMPLALRHGLLAPGRIRLRGREGRR